MKFKIFMITLILLSTIGLGCAAEGDILWQNTDLTSTIMTTTINPNGTIYCGDVNGNIYTIDPLTGDDTLVYTVAGGYIYYANIELSPDAEVLYVPDEGNHDIIALYTANFTEKWTFDSTYIFKPMVIDTDGFIYTPSGSTHMIKLDPADGSVEWDFTTTDICTSPVLSSDGSKVAFGRYPDDGYIVELNAATGEQTFTSEPSLAFGSWETPNLAYDQNDEIVYTSNTGQTDTTSIVRMAADGSLTKGGIGGFDGVGSGSFNPVTFTDDFRIVSPRMTDTATTDAIVTVYQSNLVEIFGIDQSEIGATACDHRDYIDAAGTISTDNIAYYTITRGGGTGQDVYGTGIVAIDVDNQQTLWFHESLTPYRSNYGGTSMALMDTPVKQLICYGDTTEGLIAFEVSGSPLWTRNDYDNGDIGMWMGMTQNQFTLASEEEPVVEEEETNDAYGVVVIKSSESEIEETEELVTEDLELESEDTNDKSLNVLFGESTGGSNWLIIYIFMVFGAYIGAYGITKVKDTYTPSNVMIFGTIGWLIPLLITLFIYDMLILNMLFGSESIILVFITFVIYGAISGIFAKNDSKKNSRK